MTKLKVNSVQILKMKTTSSYDLNFTSVWLTCCAGCDGSGTAVSSLLNFTSVRLTCCAGCDGSGTALSSLCPQGGGGRCRQEPHPSPEKPSVRDNVVALMPLYGLFV